MPKKSAAMLMFAPLLSQLFNRAEVRAILSSEIWTVGVPRQMQCSPRGRCVGRTGNGVANGDRATAAIGPGSRLAARWWCGLWSSVRVLIGAGLSIESWSRSSCASEPKHSGSSPMTQPALWHSTCLTGNGARQRTSDLPETVSADASERCHDRQILRGPEEL